MVVYMQWLCTCGYIYDETRGFPSKEIEPGTTFNSIDTFSCPKCSKGKESFEEIKKVEDDKNVKVITAKYDRIKDWVMDPKGYFTIKIFPEEKLIKTRYYTADGKLQCVIESPKAMDIYNTVIKEGFVSTLQHAADMGAELMKAEVCMKLDKEYTQDKPF